MDRPRLTLKLATSLDGRIATAAGESRWITGAAARAEVHKLRATHDAVMIGAGTARSDDPSLLARTEPAPERQPMRVVVSTGYGIPDQGKLYAQLEQAPLLVFGREGADPARQRLLEAAGARLEHAPANEAGLDLGRVLARIGALGATSVLAEGGGVLAAQLIAARLVERLEWFRAPIVLGAEGRPAVAALAMSRLADAPVFRRVAFRALGPDLWESYEPTS